MSALLDIQKELDVASARVNARELTLRDNPGNASITANLETAVRVQRKLQAQFMEEAARIGVEVCRYRAFDDYSRSSAGPAFGAIAAFQWLVSVVFGSLKYGPKERATVAPETAKETAMQLGFAFSGSVGVVLTVRNDTPLLEDSLLDESFDAIFQMAKAHDPQEIKSFAEKLGPGVINALYHWADSNAANGLGADIEWRRGEQVRGSLLVQRQELSHLRTAIQKTGSTHEETINIVGTLAMADVDAGRFKLKREGLPIIRGSVEPGAIDKNHEASVPHTYKARIRKTTRNRFAKGTQEVKHHLLGLKPIKKASDE